MHGVIKKIALAEGRRAAKPHVLLNVYRTDVSTDTKFPFASGLCNWPENGSIPLENCVSRDASASALKMRARIRDESRFSRHSLEIYIFKISTNRNFIEIREARFDSARTQNFIKNDVLLYMMAK